MPIDGGYDWSQDQDEDDSYNSPYDEDDEPRYYDHKETEELFYRRCRNYDSNADSSQRIADLDDMDDDLRSAIESREAENEDLGDDNGWLEGHEERIGVLRANRDALALERHHVHEEERGYNSAWNEDTQEWGEFREADYEAEGLNEEELEELYERRRRDRDGDDEEVDMDISEDEDD